MARWSRLIRNLLRRQTVETDLSAEVESYLEHLVAEKEAAGMDPAAARRAARMELGSKDQVKEEVRDVRRGASIEQLGRDLHYAFRGLHRNPGFAGFTILTFALAIGGITLIASLVDAILIRPLPYPESDRLVIVAEANAANPEGAFNVAAPNYLDWERDNRVFSRMALYEYLAFNLSGDGRPEQVGGVRVSNGVFTVLRQTPLLGRGFLPADDDLGNGRVVVLSHSLWQRRYGADSSIVGRSIRLNKEPYLVIGVMRPGFSFPSANEALWVPINLNAEDRGRGSHSFWSVARLRDGVSVEQARAELRTIADRLARQYPESNNGETANVMPMRDLWLTDVARILRILMAAVALVALIATANVASLLVARGIARRRELAARMALGGTRARIGRQLVTESAVLALLGAALGLGGAAVAIRWMVAALPAGLSNVPFRDLGALSLNLPVFGMAVLVALVAGIAAGLVPAQAVIPRSPGEVLKDGEARGSTARRGRRLRNGLVAVEVALATVVLAGAALLVVSMKRELSVDPGIDAAGVVAMAVALPQPDFYGPPTRQSFCTDVIRNLETLPGVVAASAVSHLPLSGASAGRGFVVEGAPDPGRDNLPNARYSVACPGYFRTLGIPMRDGRDFAADDRAGAPLVVIVNQALADRYFPGVNPVGRRIRFGRYDTPAAGWMTVIGVVANVHHDGLAAPPAPHLFRPYSQAAWPQMAIVAKASADPLGLVGPIREALGRIAPEEPIGIASTMAAVVDRSVGPLRFPMVMFTIFAVTALALAAVGIFGVASQAVVQRTRELGIRRAIGATGPTLYRLVLGQALAPVMLGIAGGLAGGLASGRLLRGMLFGIEPTHLPTFGAVAVVLGAVALLASLVPARRAARIDPVTALRED